MRKFDSSVVPHMTQAQEPDVSGFIKTWKLNNVNPERTNDPFSKTNTNDPLECPRTHRQTQTNETKTHQTSMVCDGSEVKYTKYEWIYISKEPHVRPVRPLCACLVCHT